MAKLIDITGQKFNHLTVIERVENTSRGQTRWKCLCDCGNTTIVQGGNLKTGEVKSCGCLSHKPAWNKTHGLSNTRLYWKWNGMKRRCYDEKDSHYKDYGGRGIKICEEWLNDFYAFYCWAMATGGDDKNLTIERIDVNGDYSPENCTWADRKTQSNNRRNCHFFTYNEKTQNLMQWCEELNLNYKLVYERIFRDHWSFEKAISTPVILDGYAMLKGKENKNVSGIFK